MRDGDAVIWWAVLLMLPLVGCGTPESVRETNYLNGEAARWIVEASPDPAIDRAASTIAAGSDQIARKLGEPEERPAYTPEVHEATVAKAKADIDQQESVKNAITGWVQNVVTKGADMLLPGLGGMLMGAWFWLRKRAQFDKLKAGVAPIVKVIDAHPEIQDKIAAYAGKIGAGGVVKAAVDFLKK